VECEIIIPAGGNPHFSFAIPSLSNSLFKIWLCPKSTCFVVRAVKITNLEICQEILLGQLVSEIPPTPFDKGGQGGFLEGPDSSGKSWLLVAALPIYKLPHKNDGSLTFRTKYKIWWSDLSYFSAAFRIPITH
jgi:hypothetical protein